MEEERSAYWKRAGRRVTRRRLLATGATAGAGAAALAAVGCGDDDDDDDDAAAKKPDVAAKGQPKPGGTLRTARSQNPPHFDPATNASFEAAATHANTMNRLVRVESGPGVAYGSLKLVGDIAASWESPDQTTYVFKLRRGMKFHNKPPVNGREVNAEDVKFTFERILDPATGSVNRSLYTQIDKIDVVDPATVRMTTKEPFAPFPYYLAHYYSAWITAKEAVAQFGDLKKEVIGTGPFVLESYQPNVQATFRRNPEFVGKPLPYLDAVEYLYVPDYQARQAGFQSKKFDLGAPTAADAPAAEKTAKDSGGGMHRFQFPLAAALIPMGRKAPFNDARVRKAIQRAIDIKQLIDVVYFGEATYAGQGVPPAMKEWSLTQDELKKLYPYDPAEAKKLLEAAGYANGFSATIYNVPTAYGPTYVDMSEIVAEQLRKVGITIKIEAKEYAAHLQTWTSENFDMVLAPRTISLTPDEFLFGQFYKGAARNFSKTDDATLNDLIAKYRRTFNEEEAKKLALDAQRKLADVMGEIPLPSPFAFASYHGHVKDYVPSMDYGAAAAQWIWLDKA